MSFFALFMLSVSLAMDAFAVSITNGINLVRPSLWQILKPALFFGAFQALMPALGWLAGRTVAHYIEAVDNWIAFIILSVIGGKMVFDAIREGKEAGGFAPPPTTGKLLVMAIATSIDAFAIGMSLAFLDVGIIASSITIGVITFFISLSGVLLGKWLGGIFQQGAVIAGGIILILIGIKILIF